MTDHDAELREIQLTLTEAVYAIGDLCDDLATPYFMVAGTLLGAVRHGGFIPWDDDVDLAMEPEAMIEFVAKARVRLGPRFTVQTRNDDPILGADVKVYVNGTHTHDAFAHAHNCSKPAHDGLFVDIFRANRLSRFALVRFVERALGWLVYVHPRARELPARSAVSGSGRMRWWLAGHLPRVAVVAIARLLDHRGLRRKGELMGLGPGGVNGPALPRAEVLPLTRITFEGRMLSAPAQPEAVLARSFGADYMIPPPEGERPRHVLGLVIEKPCD